MRLSNKEQNKIQDKAVKIFDELIKNSFDDSISDEERDVRYNLSVEKIVYLVEDIVVNNKANKCKVFVEHIEQHLEQMGLSEENVICKICDKTIDEIYTGERKTYFNERMRELKKKL